MKYPTSREGALSRHFQERYLESLQDGRLFYDDVTEVGNPAAANFVFYFVPGINGTPGQMRLVLPSLTRVFGSRIYLKALHVPEFSAQRPTWEKYTAANIDRKLTQLRADLEQLLARYNRVTVIALSTGFYDFAAAAAALAPAARRERMHVLWSGCAPDQIKRSDWERVFFPLSGFVHRGHRWFACPSQCTVPPCHPESIGAFGQGPTAGESRFRCLGVQWKYVSTSQLNAAVRHVVRRIGAPLDLPATALIGGSERAWQGPNREWAERRVRQYLPRCQFAYRPAPQLWSENPPWTMEPLARLKRAWPQPSGNPPSWRAGAPA
jgi:hypothetical protein